jgi:hypothetical protein
MTKSTLFFQLLRTAALALAVLTAAAGRPAAAGSILWYNGDFNGQRTLANGNGITPNGNASGNYNVYDDFTVSSPGWIVSDVFSNDDTNFLTTTAHWEIRSGVSSGNAGTLVAGGDAAATQTLTGRTAFGLPEYTFEVSGLNVLLSAGTYWLTVAPIGPGTGNSFDTETFGANAVGTPPGNNGNSFINAPVLGINYQPAINFTGDNPTDFSMGVIGTLQGQSLDVPEIDPGSAASALALLAMGGTLLNSRRRARA